eukprot:2782098-Pyramimonas_sp.AAC.1
MPPTSAQMVTPCSDSCSDPGSDASIQSGWNDFGTDSDGIDSQLWSAARSIVKSPAGGPMGNPKAKPSETRMPINIMSLLGTGQAETTTSR